MLLNLSLIELNDRACCATASSVASHQTQLLSPNPPITYKHNSHTMFTSQFTSCIIHYTYGTLQQAETSCKASSQPVLIQKYFLIMRMLSFLISSFSPHFLAARLPGCRRLWQPALHNIQCIHNALYITRKSLCHYNIYVSIQYFIPFTTLFT